jgi:ATP-dependent DNA helicase DinG
LGFKAKTRHPYVSVEGDFEVLPTFKTKWVNPSPQKPVPGNPRRLQANSLGEQDYYGFEVNADNLYVLGNFIVTHNSGKSNLGVTLSAFLSQSKGDAFILTPQKVLQKQYEDSFPEEYIGSLYGRANYECIDKKTNCDIGSDIKPRCEYCPAKAAKTRAMLSPNMVLNYKLALLLFKFADPRKFRPRKLMIMDECHTLENHLCDFNAVSVSDKRCRKLNVQFIMQKNVKDALQWLVTTYWPKLKVFYRSLCEQVDAIEDELQCNPRALTNEEKNTIKLCKEYDDHVGSIDFLMSLTVEEVQERFVVVEEKQSFRFKELYGRNVFHGLVAPMADQFLFMSATILDKAAYCRDLGIDPNQAAFITLPSEFPLEHRPIIFMPVMKMNYEWKSDDNLTNRQNLIITIKDILSQQHGEDSGIIHTGSFQVAEFLVEYLSNIVQHDIYHHNPSAKLNRDDVLAEFQRVSATQPSLLISPSITEGLDLKDDLSRFAIFVKVPFPYMGDAWVKRRMEISPSWYSRQAMISIMQGAGRVVRSPQDFGCTYILDSSFNYLYYQMQNYLPQWWKDGLQRW